MLFRKEIFFSLLFALTASLACAQERVLDFHSDIRIAANGELTVTEIIAVQAEGRQIRRGIFRDFPTDYDGPLGGKVKVPFQVLKVTRDGRDEPYALEPLDNGMRVRIGSANVLLPPGRRLYQITYRTARQLGFFAKHDELYWNVNGTGWPFAFDRLSAEVRLPQNVPGASLKLEAYTGPQGARGTDYDAIAREGGAVFRTNRPLRAYEGLTLVVAFPKGIVTPPSRGERVRWWLSDNRAVASGIAGWVLLFGTLFWRWWTVGRDPRRGPEFPRYEAPPGLGPAGVRFVDKMGYDDRCFAVALLGLGERGYLKIRQQGRNYVIERTGKEVSFLPGEKAIAERLFAGAPTRVLEPKHDPLIEQARNRLSAELERHFGHDRLFARNRRPLFFGVAAALGIFGAMVYLDAPDEWIFGMILLLAATLFLFERILPAYSIAGRKLADAIAGLRQYLGIAEADELRRMKAPPQTAEEFSRFLPYAVALDVEKTWGERFTATLGLAAVTAAVSHYYSGDTGGGFFGDKGIGGLTGMADLGSTIAAASTAPGSTSGSSGGGGGGGGSGGGGGGGGGGGW